MEGDKETFVSGARTRHFNPLPPHGGRPGAFSCATMTQNISIHSLRMEGDIEITVITHVTTTISIHSLRMEGDIKETPKTSMKSFQSTPSAWRETIGVVETVTPIWDFNPLPPHGGRRTFLLMLLLHRTFQSTPSAWRETDRIHDGRNSEAISIHSLRMEGDSIPSIASNARFISIHSLLNIKLYCVLQ